ncbi:MAG: response regulator [Leptolyngbyaceae cyanobacterium]
MANKCILVIDDEVGIHTVAQIGLTLETDWKVLTALSGAEGVEIALKQQPDAILLDAMMPQQGGIETLKILRASPRTRDIPIIFFTAKVQAAHRREFYSLGAKGIISKPFDPTTLASQISGFLGWQE